MNIDDFLNNEFDGLDNNQKKIIKNLFDMNNFNDDIESNLDLSKEGLFLHELSSKEAQEELNKLIKEHSMTQKIKFIETYEGRVIEEIWTSEDKMMRLKRYYPFTYDNINTLPTETRKYIYDKILDKALDKEDYELAAEIRDSIIINE